MVIRLMSLDVKVEELLVHTAGASLTSRNVVQPSSKRDALTQKAGCNGNN